MANADISLLFGVLGEGSLSGESGALIQSQLNQIMASLNKNPLKVKVALDTETGGQKSWSSQLQSKLNTISTSGKFSVKVSKIELGAGAITDFKKQLNAVINTLNLDKGTSITLTAEGIGEIKSQMREAGNAADEAARKVAEFKVQMEALGNLKTSVQKSLSSLTNGNETEEEKARIAGLTTQYEQWAIKIEEVRASKTAVSGTYRAELEAEGAAIQDNINKLHQERQAAADAAAAQQAETKSRQAAEDAAKRAAEEARAAEEKARVTAAERNTLYKQISDAIVRIRKAQQDWNAAENGKSSSAYADLEGYIKRLQDLQGQFGNLSKTQIREQLTSINKEFAESSNVIKAAGENTKTLTGRIGNLAGKFTSWLTVSQVIMQVYRALKQMVTAVIEVDTAMTELRKVTDETEATYSEFLDTASVRAKSIGATIADTVNATADFARLGHSIADASVLADAAIVYKNVGDGIEDINQASESIISTMQAFGIEAANVMTIVDKFNIVGNKFAISSTGIGEALLNSASALAAAGNTLDESIALITAANEVIQNPEKVGTAMKTMSMYIRAAKTEAEEAGIATDGMANSVSELRAEILALTGHKVDIMIDENTFKSTVQVMRELATVWDELTDISRTNITELIGGGVRNANVISALIDNFRTVEEVIATAADSTGSALAENEKYLDSIAGKVSQFKATFEELSITLIDSESVKQIVDFGSGLLNILNSIFKVVDALGGLNTVLKVTIGILAIVKANSIVSTVTNIGNKLHRFGNDIAGVFEIFTDGFKAAKDAGSSSLTAIGNGFKNVAALASTAQIAVAAFVVVITAAISIYQSHQQALSEQKNAAIDAANALNEASGSIEDYKSQIIELRAAIDSGNLSEKEAYDKRQELITIQKSLIDMFGKEAEGIDLVTASIDSQILTINNLSKAKWTAYKQENTGAIRDAVDLFTDFSPDKLDFWSSSVGGGFTIEVPSQNELNDAINDLDLDMVITDFYADLEKRLLDADIGVEIPIAGIVGDFTSDLNVDSIYEALEVYQSLYDITEDLGKDYFGTDYLDYVGSALEGYSKHINAIKTELEESGAIFDTYVEGLLNYDEKYSGIWGKILSAQKEYNNAVLDGDSSAIANAIEKMETAEEAFLSSGWDNDAVNLYVSEFFDEWNAASNNYKLRVDVEAKLADDGDTIGNDIKDALKKFEDEAGVVDIYRILNGGETQEQIDAYNRLKEIANECGGEIEDLCAVLLDLGYIEDATAESTNEYRAKLTALTDVLSKLQSAYNALESAEMDMAAGRSLTVETIAALAAAEEDYLNYIYEENGVLMLNTEAWKDNANAKMLHEMTEIELEISSLIEQNRLLEEQNNTLQDNIKYYEEQRAAGSDGGMWNQLIADSTAAINDNNEAIAENTDRIRENQGSLAVYGTLYSDITGDISAYNAALENFAKVANVIDSVATSYAGLYNLQNAVAEGFTFSLDKILEYAQAYPEILNSATVTANGELALNEAVVNSFIDGKKAELNAQIDAEIAKLEADKAVLEAKKESATAQLELAKAVVNGETQLTREEAIYKLNTGNALAEALVAWNVDRATAYKLATAAMAENEEEFTRIAMGCFQNMDENSAKAAYNMAHAIYVNAQNSALSIADIAKQAHETARAIRGMADGVIEGADYSIFNGGSGVYIGTYDYNAEDGNFVGTEYNYESKQISLDEYIAELELDISSYENAIEQINGQIATLEALRNTPFESFKNLVDNASSIVGEKTNDKIEQEQKDAEKAAEEAKKAEEEKQKLVEEYIAAIDEYYMALKRLEEVQKRRVSLEKKLEHTEDLSEKIFLSSGLIDVYKEEAEAERNLMAAKQATISANVGALRGLGFQVSYDPKTNELYIKNLEHLNELTANSAGEYETLQEATNALRKETEDLIETTEQLNQDNIDAAENIEDLGYEILETKNNIIDYIEEIYDKQVESYQKIIDLRKELIESAKDEYDYEADIAEKVKEIADLQSRIDQLALDDSRSAQAERASLMQELADKQQELADTQGDHATDSQLDALDKMAEDYEQQRADEIEIMRNTVTESEELWNAFYQTILGNNATVGASVDEHIANAWIRAAQAVNDYSAAMSGISSGGVVINSIPKYHTGGVVDEVNVGKDETLALLEKGEVVLNDGKQQTLYKIIDFQEELSKRLGTVIGSLVLPDITGSIRSLVGGAVNNITENSQSLVFEPHIQVEINHSGTMNDTDAKSYGEKIADTAIEKLYSAFERRGISSTRASRLKP